MKEKLIYLKKINIAKLIAFSYIFVMSLFMNNVKVEAKTTQVISSTYKGNSQSLTPNALKTINGIDYIQGTGMSNQDGITFIINDAYNDIKDFTAMAVWEQGYTSSSDFRDYDRWYIESIKCDPSEYDTCPNQLDSLLNKEFIQKDKEGKMITHAESGQLYYIVASADNKNLSSVKTDVDFSKFFTERKIIYTYRIRNLISANNQRPSFGFKEIHINFWKALSENEEVDTKNEGLVIKYGLAKPISDVDSYSNYNNPSHSDASPIVCLDHQDEICIDYVDSNGEPSKSTTAPSEVNIYMPNVVAYNHSSKTIDEIKNTYLENHELAQSVIDTNTLYGLNYFCESDSIVPAIITHTSDGKHIARCPDGGQLRKYLYVGSELKSNSMNDVVEFRNDQEFFISTTYNTNLLVDSRGNYVVIIRDVFGNTNEIAVINVEDIINQAILAYFDKSNAKEEVVEANGWKANEYLTNQDVKLAITMTATTVIKNGLPIIEAKTTKLDERYVKEISYWRVSGENYNSDICYGDNGDNCAMKPDTNNMTNLYTGKGSGKDPITNPDDFVSFNANTITMNIHSNGRYRFYIETFSGNNTNASEGAFVKGESKNPRVEVYKIDKSAPEIMFGNEVDSKCTGPNNCTHIEETYNYYQGTGSPSGSIINKLATVQDEKLQIDYKNNLIYYISANGQKSVLGSASDADVFYTYLLALFNTQTYIKENLLRYDNEKIKYSHSDVSKESVNYTLDYDGFDTLDEEAYRMHVISNDIKYTAFSLATNKDITIDIKNKILHQDNIKIEYIDGSDGSTPVCDKIATISEDLNNDKITDQNDCVNYYLDHGIDFDIRITVYDIIEELVDNQGKLTTKYILGNETIRTIKVDVVDTTAPGFNSIINRTNKGTECRVELGNLIGSTLSDQDLDVIYNCYGITKEGPQYNFEDNVFKNLYTQEQTVNNREHVNMYILSKETKKWVNLDEGYIPNRSGYYALFIVIRDDANTSTTFDMAGENYHDVMVSNDSKVTVQGNAIGLLASYYVDKKIVLVTPKENVKTYGDKDPIFEYCVSINKNTLGIKEFLDKPFKDMTVFTNIGCANYLEDHSNVSLTDEVKKELFKGNYTQADFTGKLSRQESFEYNDTKHSQKVNKSNDYVGLYKIVLGSLDISDVGQDDGYDLADDYIIKINPNSRSITPQTVRDSNKTFCNMVNTQIVNGQEITDCYPATEDDDFYVESTVLLTIKQTVLVVSANGSEKTYGDIDPNSKNYNADILKEDVVKQTAYLNGYTVAVEGLKYNDTPDIVIGSLRRQVGEDVGVYSICNYRGNQFEDNVLEYDKNSKPNNNMLILGTSVDYTDCSTFDPYAQTDVRVNEHTDGILNINKEYIESRALYIKTNKRDWLYKNLNSTEDDRNNKYSNYVIEFNANVFKINPSKMYVQPAPGQRREYSYSGVDEVNPWEIIVYGQKDFLVSVNEDFNGYTQNSPKYSTLSNNDPQSVDTDRTKLDQENYNNASESRDEWKLIEDKVAYLGNKTNETYSLFKGRISLKGRTPQDGVYKDMFAGWYMYDDLIDSSLELVTNGRKQCSYANYITSSGVGNGFIQDCRNYDLNLDLEYRDLNGNKNGDIVNGETVNIVYKGKLGYCKSTPLGEISDPDVVCGDDISSKILFEVYRREIILEFNSLLEKVPSNGKDIVYGNRYDYYDTNLFKIALNSANTNYLENHLFYCYASYEDGKVGVSGDCTNNKWYGLTEGDSWLNVGLEFHMHKLISSIDSDYYDTETDFAIPSGRYYIYSSISQDAKRNYKYNYLGGTFTIKTKTVGVTLNNYSKEYGNVYYDNLNCLIKDGSILNPSNDLISDCLNETNTVDNTYGFVIDGLDSKDFIKNNFIGRPNRDSNLDKSFNDINGLQENVGIYDIHIGSIHSKNNNSFNSCVDNFIGDEEGGCVTVKNVNINNYTITNDDVENLTYYLHKNGKDYSSPALTTIVNPQDMTLVESKLTINPATITITVTKGQTKMYGCSYNLTNTNSLYQYDYQSGYDCIQTTGKNYDLGYGYTVSGDKDYYIYNFGYYDENYNFDTTYTTSGINQVNKNAVVDSLLKPKAIRKGYRSSALNGGSLYRINYDIATNPINYSTLVEAANKAQDLTHYQGQKAGDYIITLGNLNSTLTSDYLVTYKEVNNKVCGVDNLPGNGNEVCRNYIIDYYNHKSTDDVHNYNKDKKEGTDIKFTITSRVAFVYAKYNSKVYGNDDPNITLTCDNNMIDQGICSSIGDKLNLGLTQYYTKFNSLAKAPYVASIETNNKDISFELTNKNDTQIDVATGAISRIGMDNKPKNVNDIVGTYNYIYDGVTTTGYATGNYKLDFYYRHTQLDKINILNGEVDNDTNPFILDKDNFNQNMAVNENGKTDALVDNVEKKVYFEINLRKITVSLIPFAKTYGIEDNSKYYDLGICATGDQVLGYDIKGNPICSFVDDIVYTDHGLSPSHLDKYVKNGILDQEAFKTDFNVKFVRSLGENVRCPGKNVSATINGFFTDRTTEFTYDLGCNKNGYEALGIIDQSDRSALGYNYEITYIKGTMNIVERTIMINPDGNQGFQYGSYTYPSLIPAITFTNELVNSNYNNKDMKVVTYNKEETTTTSVIVNRDGTLQLTSINTNPLGLVSNNKEGRICLTNIDGVNKFCINDMQDTYDVDNKESSTSEYVYNQDGLDNEFTTYVFGDVYKNESSPRSALNREILAKPDQRYNRNVGIYTITIGDLADKSGNYVIKFNSGVNYTITPSDILITPDSNQNKTYGEADKELTFKVVTTYTINSTQYITNDASIYSIVNAQGEKLQITNTKEPILVTKGSTITLNGFAYYENSENANYNYGVIKNSNKSGSSAGISQNEVIGESFDKYCYDNYSDNSNVDIGVIEGCSDRKVSFATTNLNLVGYLHVENYTQRFGTYKIINGMVVSDNEHGNKNYTLSFTDDVTFRINQLDINLYINTITKTYGEATDSYKCEDRSNCLVNGGILTAQDNENMLEYNFDISYKDGEQIIQEGSYEGNSEVLMVNAINNNYYTQSESREDKNNFLGVIVLRQNNNNTVCSVSSDGFGCEDAGKYNLVIKKFDVTLDSAKDGSNRYDDNYNLMVSNKDVELIESKDEYVVVNPNNHLVENPMSIQVIKGFSEIMTIEAKKIDIFVNTNLNISETNYYEIEQNIEVPQLPTIDNSYDLTNYVYDENGTYHGVGEQASSKSDNEDLDSTYTKIVWGNHPRQVRTKDALVGEVAYCNEPVNGNNYLDRYPTSKNGCTTTGQLVYNDEKYLVNTSIKSKFITITRNTGSNRGLKILPTALTSNVANNDYENKNYVVTFYPGAVHVVGDEKDPVLNVGNKDYYIEANAIKQEGQIKGNYSSIGTILEYLTTLHAKSYILAKVNDNGELTINIEGEDVVITSSSLWNKYGSSSKTYPGIVSGIEQKGVYPFISEYAHLKNPIEGSKEGSYLNEENIKLLEELITTFIKWFDVNSYDAGQYLNGQYLPRKFDRYYYIAINKTGYDIANDIDNEFAINKVGTYNLSFYVMDNSGRISKDGNIARLHIIDTTKPELGTINLYNSPVKCDNNCNDVSSWYINANKVRLSSFNRFRKNADSTYSLDSAGDYIYFSELGNDALPYKLISELEIETVDYIKYLNLNGKKYLAEGVRHYTWDSNPTGIYLVISGGKDNSFTLLDDSNASQWKHYFSLDGGNYWIDYEVKLPMEGKRVLFSDGVREIKIMTIDSGVSIFESSTNTYSVTYKYCYDDCPGIDVINKVNIKGSIKEFTNSKVNNAYFNYDNNTKCTLNSIGTLISCKEGESVTKVKLEGNEFTYKGIKYILLGNNVLTKATKEFKAHIVFSSVTLDSIDYRYDPVSGMIYKEHIATFGDSTDKYTELKLNGTTYLIYGNQIRYRGETIATIENGKFTLNGLTYTYIVDASKDNYYYASEEYKVYQDSFIIEGKTYNINSLGEVNIGGNTIVISKHKNYKNTYTEYDRFLKGIEVTYSDSSGGGNSTLKPSEEIINFTIAITKGAAWNKADEDKNGYKDKQISEYLNASENTLYYQDRQTAYLDTTSPTIGIIMSEDGKVVRYGNGDKLFTYEFGYYNTTKVIDGSYNLRGNIYTVNAETMEVSDPKGVKYKITPNMSSDPNKQFYYEINYITYYLDSTMENVYWLPGYIEKYVGGKDISKGGSINAVEIPRYDIRTSVKVGGITTDTLGVYQLMDKNSTNTTLSSGIGSDQYKTSGTNNLYDFIYLGEYQSGIYYEDIDYIVSYTYENKYYEVNLNTQFKVCYDEYTDNTGKHMITQDCAQKIIKDVIKPRGDLKKDITYDIIYVIRDKAGNPSPVVAKGVIYATILPSTNVIISNIDASNQNSQISVLDLGNNTYSLKANQGVSLELLDQAFKVNYNTRYNYYNDQARMDIYRDDELIKENVKGVNFTDYIDSNQIADYKVVYNMKSKYTPAFGDKIDVSGEEVTLYVSIASPKVDIDNDMNIQDITNNNTSLIGIVMLLLAVIGGCVLIVTILLKKKKR